MSEKYFSLPKDFSELIKHEKIYRICSLGYLTANAFIEKNIPNFVLQKIIFNFPEAEKYIENYQVHKKEVEKITKLKLPCDLFLPLLDPPGTPVAVVPFNPYSYVILGGTGGPPAPVVPMGATGPTGAPNPNQNFNYGNWCKIGGEHNITMGLYNIIENSGWSVIAGGDRHTIADGCSRCVIWNGTCNRIAPGVINGRILGLSRYELTQSNCLATMVNGVPTIIPDDN